MKLFSFSRRKKQADFGFFGDYRDWEEANAATTGYRAPAVIQSYVDARRALSPNLGQGAVLDGWSLQLIATLAFVLAKSSRPSLRVMDFGGGWGRYFYACRQALPGIAFDWTVVETPEMTQALAGFEEPGLRWRSSMPEIHEPGFRPFDLGLASGSLAYLARPYEVLERAATISRHLVINRHPVITEAEDKIVIQKVPPHIFAGSFPCWLFSAEKFRRALQAIGDLRWTWDVPQDGVPYQGKAVPHRGYFVEIDRAGPSSPS